MEKVFIGIDPGRDGALAIVLDSAPEHPIIRAFDRTAYVDELRRLVSYQEMNHYTYRCVLEHVGAMPGQGSVSMFHFGENFGWIQGVLDTLHIPYELVRPQKWKREFSCTSDKNTSIQVAQRLFPNVDLRRTEKCKGPHDGICEALLMACFAQRRMS